MQIGIGLQGFLWRQLAAFLLLVGAIQIAYWQFIDLPLSGADISEAPPRAELVSTQIARIDTPDFAAASRATYQPVELPWTHCCDTAMFAVRIGFKVDAVAPGGLGIISTLQADNYHMAVNGSVLFERGEMEVGKTTFHGQKTFLTRVPAGLLRPGINELTYVTVRDGFPYTDIYPPTIADYRALDSFSARRLFFAYDFYVLSALAIGLLGVLAGIMVFRADDWKFAAWLSGLSASLLAYMVYTVWLDPPLDGWGRMLAFYAIYLAIPAALLCFVDSWTGHPLRFFQGAVVAAYAGIVGVIAVYIYRVPMPEGFDQPAVIWGWALIAAAVAISGRLVWHFVTRRETRLIESALLTVMATALVFDVMAQSFPEWGIREGNLLNSSAFLLLAMTAAFLARNFRLFQSQGALNEMLQAKVAQREAELAEAAVREQTLVRAQAHDEERRRIMRDLHDGLGSQLMTMMLSARLGEADPPKVAEGLQSVIDEMRLMVDSMDSVGESLEAALATFRARIQPRIEAAGFAFHWSQPDALPNTGLGPRDVLQVFRIMQEAVTNALKHSGGTEIAVTVKAERDDAVAITIADDGRGGADQGDAGRGLVNMRTRARALGADYDLQSDQAQGTRVTLMLRQPAMSPHPI